MRDEGGVAGPVNILPVCVLYTQDAAVARRVKGFLKFVAMVRQVDQAFEMEAVCRQFSPALVLVDLFGESARELLPRLARSLPHSLFIALGAPRSDPVLEAEGLGVYAVEDLNLDRPRLQSLVTRALDHLRLARENRLLKQDTAVGDPVVEPAPAPAVQHGPLPLRQFAQAFRHFDNVEALLEGLVEAVASYARASRVGVFAVVRGSSIYRMCAGAHCLETTAKMEFSSGDPLVSWLRLHAHIVSRKALGRVEDPSERMLLEQALGAMGAEVVVPLHGRRRLLGWLLLGRRVTGAAYGDAELEELHLLADPVSITLENALLYEEVALQKTLAETVLQSIPIGIVAVGTDAKVRWFNEGAEQMLALPAADLGNARAAKLGSRLESLLAHCLAGNMRSDPLQWQEPVTRRFLSALACPLGSPDRPLGAVAIIRDLTRERLLAEKQDQLERASFWTELAAAISHEVRNPLVAINTFAQLLPERYEDPEFRTQFSDLATREISRLSRMIDQLNAFATPPEPVFADLDLEDVLRKAATLAGVRLGIEGVSLPTSVAPSARPLRGDARALADCFAHLIVNALEATRETPKPAMSVDAVRDRLDGKDRVKIEVRDNGQGIPPEILDEVFSPFCSMKARGLGLGLPIARRTVADHGGEIAVDSGGAGTVVTVMLPSGNGAPGGEET